MDFLEGAHYRHGIHLIVFYEKDRSIGDFHFSFPLV